jgi:transposase InsO family protein
LALGTLGVFVAASAVRSILLRLRPRPAAPSATPTQPQSAPITPGSVVARYPNRAWSVDLTKVHRWRLWPTYVLLAIDHYSRKVVALAALPSADSDAVLQALKAAFGRHGAPKHLITDQEPVFTSRAFRDLLAAREVTQRFGAVGKHGSIAVTERAILTLKREWLWRVPLIKGTAHLGTLLADFAQYYNGWRGHTWGGQIAVRPSQGLPTDEASSIVGLL